MKIEKILVQRLELPLKLPYKVSQRTHISFTPIVIRILSNDLIEGWGEAYISPGYTDETESGAIDFCKKAAHEFVGKDSIFMRDAIKKYAAQSPCAASALLNAIDMLENDTLLQVKEEIKIPLLAPCQGHEESELRDEISELLEQGFKTLKVKVGFDVKADLDRVYMIQSILNQRAMIRLDANRAFTKEQGSLFASQIDPIGIELFEQPCGSSDWDSNAAVALVSKVPVMLDESIYNISDIDRASSMKGVGFVKLKLKKIGSLEMLHSALNRIRSLGMEPVLGDGVSMEIGCWMEACVARTTITNAGEMNGFLKPKTKIFSNPLPFADGAIVLPVNYTPTIDESLFKKHMTHQEIFSV